MPDTTNYGSCKTMEQLNDLCNVFTNEANQRMDEAADSEGKVLKGIGSNQSDTPVVDYNVKFIPIFRLPR